MMCLSVILSVILNAPAIVKKFLDIRFPIQ
jgi:hypothetical protein